LKKILLLGDSIRQNYQEYVKYEMQNIAKIYFPNDNGKFGYLTLRYLHDWIKALLVEDGGAFDVVHFNCGLWDVLRLSNEEDCFTGEKEYAEVLKRIVDRIHYLCPNAKLIFALTTKVIEPGFAPGIEYGERRNSDIIRYNQIAKECLYELDVEVNDLWSVTDQLGDEAHSDQVHYDTEIAIKALGDQVIKSLKKYC